VLLKAKATSLVTNTVIATIPVGTNPNGVGTNPLTNRIYVTNQDDNNVSVIDGVTQTVITTILVGARPFAVGVNT
jgi:YVTN family beta-propeller protein